MQSGTDCKIKSRLLRLARLDQAIISEILIIRVVADCYRSHPINFDAVRTIENSAGVALHRGPRHCNLGRMPKPPVRKSLDDYYARIARWQVAPLWERLAKLVPPEPQIDAVPYLWDYDA